jgi:hypothetical protein
MPYSPITARNVASILLERTGDALLTGDFELFHPCFLLPQEVQTFEGRRMIKNKEDLRQLFDGVRAFHRKSNITQLVRNCVEASFLDPDTISSTHESRLLRGAELIERPYPVHSILKRVGMDWQIVSSEYAVPDIPDLVEALLDLKSVT